MLRPFENPWVILILVIVVVLLFAAPKLPGMARSLGQSMRILKSEVKEMKNDGKESGTANQAGTDAPVEGKVIPPKRDDQADGGASGPSTRA